MNRTEIRIEAWEKLSRIMMFLMSDPYKNHTQEEANEIFRTQYLGKNSLKKALNTLNDCRVLVKAEAMAKLRKDADALQAKLDAS